MSLFWQDLRFALRLLLKTPLFTAIALLSLALGIGANTAVFSLVNGVFLRPLPYERAEELVVVRGYHPDIGQFSASYPDFEDFRNENKSFSFLVAFQNQSLTQIGNGEPMRLNATAVAGNYFALFGAKPLLGQLFSDKPENEQVVVLSQGLWQRNFGSNPQIIGQALNLNNQSYTVIGVASADFRAPEEGELWLPLKLAAAIQADRSNRFLSMFARLKTGVNLTQAEADLGITAQRLAQNYPDTNAGRRVILTPLQEELVGNTRQPLLIVLATVGLVLLIACFNLASLFLARAASRAREMAIRIALGAKPQHLLRQFLTESLLLSLGGGFGGLLVAFWGRDLLVTWLEISPISQTSIDLPVLLFTLAVVILTGVLIGLIPALRVIRLDPQMMLKEGGNSGLGSYRNWGHKIFVVAEISLALTVLIAAGLLLNTLLALRQIDLGFNAQNLLTAELLLPENKYQTPTQQVAFYDQLLQQLATLPTQPQAAIVSLLPLNPRYQATRFFLEGQPAPAAGQFNRSNFHVVSPKYFTTMGIPLIAGRDFTNDDRQGKPEYMIVSQKMAARFWPNQDPLGRRVSFESPNGPWVTVIGVVADARYLALESEAEAEFYVTYLQSPQPNMALVLRANNPTSFIGGLRNIVTTIDKYQPVDNLRTMEQIIDDRLGANRMLTTILGIFAFIALLLSMLGIYAITAYNVTQRTREIGIRLALGAPPSAILTLILKQSLILMALGLAVGIAGAVAVARSIASLLYGLEPLNISLFGGCIVILAIIGLLASLLPARRATQVDPLIALKYD